MYQLLLGAIGLMATCIFGHSDAELVYLLNITEAGIFSESIEYDSVNNKLYFSDFLTGVVYSVDFGDDAISSIEAGTYSYDLTNTFNNNGYSLSYPSGMYTNGKSLYIANIFSGQLICYDVINMTAFGAISVTHSSGYNANLNGLCVNPSDTNILYATDIGLDPATGFTTQSGRGGIYKIDLTTNSYEMIYNSASDTLQDGTQYNMHPNGCIVSSDGGMMYIVEFFNDTGSLITYDITNNEFYRAPIDISGDGIELDNDGNLYFGSWDGGILYKVDFDDTSYTSATVTELLSGIVNPADMTYVDDYNYIVIPSLYQSLYYFISLGDDIPTTTYISDDVPTTTYISDDSGAIQQNLCKFISMILCTVTTLWLIE